MSTCAQCLENQAAWPMPVCLRCFTDDQIGRAELEREREEREAAKNEEVEA